jgi:hypothetical protein
VADNVLLGRYFLYCQQQIQQQKMKFSQNPCNKQIINANYRPFKALATSSSSGQSSFSFQLVFPQGKAARTTAKAL